MSRLENLLGAQALAIADRLADPAARSEAGALVTLLACPGRGIGWLSDVLGLTDSGGTRLVERLVAAGMVAREPGLDARSRTLQLTQLGTEQARRLLADRDRELADCLDPLSTSERRTLERLLAKVVGGLADDRPSALRVCRLCDRRTCAGDTGLDCPLEHTTAEA